MSFMVSNHTRSKLLLVAYVIGAIAVTAVSIDLLYRFWRFLCRSVDVCVLLGNDQVKLFINH